VVQLFCWVPPLPLLLLLLLLLLWLPFARCASCTLQEGQQTEQHHNSNS
jgi:hypothetical protein